MDQEAWMAEVKENATFRGEVRQFIVSAPASMKSAAAEAIAAHNADKDAHGAGVKREIDKKVVGWAGVAATALTVFAGAIGAAVHKAWSHIP